MVHRQRILNVVSHVYAAHQLQEEFVEEILRRHSRIKFFFKIIVKAVSPLLFPFIGVPASQVSLGDGGDLFLG